MTTVYSNALIIGYNQLPPTGTTSKPSFQTSPQQHNSHSLSLLPVLILTPDTSAEKQAIKGQKNMSSSSTSTLCAEKDRFLAVQYAIGYYEYLIVFSCQFFLESFKEQHVEDHHLYSINCMHLSAPKMWRDFLGKDAITLDAAMRKHLPNLFA
ncbi:lysine-specific demethylase JMJ16 [Artemisia annua]|uniref:Lysine-specific demethylase JMJ16 n=1 Tax=Artemisia annua TaxID=35608 RepID=A0A2U1N1G2_ARTAN|nr:lysine-specific demethylase JMJ16 [Artemisia annua]